MADLGPARPDQGWLSPRRAARADATSQFGVVHADLYQQRNKPKEPPKAPERAPFFLSSLSSLDGSKPRRLASDKTGEDQLPAAAELSRITKLSIVGGSSSERSFTVLLREGARSGNCEWPPVAHFPLVNPIRRGIVTESRHNSRLVHLPSQRPFASGG